MGNVKIRYYVTRQHEGRPKWGYWAPCLARRDPTTKKIEPTLMAKLGFALVDCGQDGPRAWSIAQSWNAKWDAAKATHGAGESVPKLNQLVRVFPPNSLGEAYERYRQTGAFKGKAKGTRDNWARGWRQIEPVFGDVDPPTIGLEDIDLWYCGDGGEIKGLLETIGVSEAYMVMKIWRALWKVAGTINRPAGGKYCDSRADPSLGIRRKTPTPRTAVWREGEAVRLVKRAWRMDLKGLACIMATAWDTSLSPVDVRTLTRAQMRGDAQGPFFELQRAKTGKAAIGTLSKRAQSLIELYRTSLLPAQVIDTIPMFRTAGAAPGPKGGRRWLPQAYSKDKLGRDFRDVVAAEFPGDTRKLADFRRSGAKEAELGGVTTAALGRKLANNIESDAKLHDTYMPAMRQDATLIRLADAARVRGRDKLREGGSQ